MDDHKIDISVIIPTYKPDFYLWECLDSLCKQSFSHDHFEVLLVLNGCNEPYYSEINNYISSHFDCLFKLFQIDISGVSNARNIGLENAKGDYITFIDDDDYVSPTYLEELYNSVQKNIVSLCYPLSFVDETSDFTPYYITEDYPKNIDKNKYHLLKAKRYFSGAVYKLIHRDIIASRRFNTSFRNGEDSIFMFEISDKITEVSFTSKEAIYYRRIRQGSALLRNKNKKEIVSNCFKMISAYSQIYFKHPFRYNVLFFITRILGAIHGSIYQLRRSKMIQISN